MADGALDGMQTFDGELEELIGAGHARPETALSYATNRTTSSSGWRPRAATPARSAAPPIGLKGAPKAPARPARQPSEMDDLIER